MVWFGIGLIAIGVFLFLFTMAINKHENLAKAGFLIVVVGILVCLIGIPYDALN